MFWGARGDGGKQREDAGLQTLPQFVMPYSLLFISFVIP
jgi:hypothetical protein